MFETVNELDDETFTKEKNILLIWEPNYSLLSGNVEYLVEIDTPLLIEADVTQKISEDWKTVLCFYWMMWKVCILFFNKQRRYISLLIVYVGTWRGGVKVLLPNLEGAVPWQDGSRVAGKVPYAL